MWNGRLKRKCFQLEQGLGENNYVLSEYAIVFGILCPSSMQIYLESFNRFSCGILDLSIEGDWSVNWMYNKKVHLGTNIQSN